MVKEVKGATMTELQKYLVSLLKEVDEICTANHIDYYIFAGSMLGAERNEGILPWDDDIDLIMTKQNYERFREIMKTQAPPDRTFETVGSNKEYPLQFGRYVSTETSHITRSLAFGHHDAGIWIDIMYAVPMPKSERKIHKIRKWFSCYCELENEIYVEYKNRYPGFFWRYRLGKLLISLFGKERVIRHLKKNFDYYPEEECDSYLLYHALNTDFKTFDKKFFGKPVRRKFGGIEVNVSPYNREFCREGYGDSWMMVPEKKEQETHTVILDFEIPYKKYYEDYIPLLNEETVLADIKSVKVKQIQSLHREKAVLKEKNKLNGILFVERFRNIIREQKIDLKKLVEAEEYEKIGELYHPYMELQFSNAYLKWNSFVPMDEDMLYPILTKLVYCDGKYYQAKKILGLREQAGLKLQSMELQNIQKMIAYCRDLSIAIWDLQDYNSAELVLRQASELEQSEERICSDMELGRMQLSLRSAADAEAYSAVKKEVFDFMQRFPLRGEGLKLLGDIEFATGNREAALEQYEQAAERTQNGLLLLDIEKKKEECRREK